MAIAKITAVLKAHDSIGIARHTWTMYPGHNLEYCLEGEKLKSILIAQYVHAESLGKGRGKMSTPGPCLY